jgi:integrase
MGFCVLPDDSPDSYLKGASIKLENLSLALLADKELVENYLEFRKLRSGLRVKPIDGSTSANLPPHKISANGRWEYYDKGGKYNEGSLQVLSYTLSLLHPRTGYLCQHPEFSEKLGARMTAETWEEQCRGTRDRVNKIYKYILQMEKKGDRENYDFGRDPKELIQWILDLPRPIFILQEMIKDMLEDLLPGSALMVERARQYRDILLVALLCANPLRIRMFSNLMFDKNLIRRNDGSWWLKFGRRAFKNRRALKSDYHVRIAEELWPILDRYKEEFHPVLVGSTESKYVFVGAGHGPQAREIGKPICEESLSRIIRNLTELYLPGAIGFRAHAFRHIIATDIIKKDPRLGFFLAAIALHDKLQTVEKEYTHLKTSEYFEPVNTHFSEAWSVVFKSSRAKVRHENAQIDSR